MATANDGQGVGGGVEGVKYKLDYIIGYGIQEYYNDTIERRRNFKRIGLYVYSRGKVIRLPCENSIAYFLYDFPFLYYNDFLELFFSREAINELKANKVNSYNALLNHIRRPIL